MNKKREVSQDKTKMLRQRRLQSKNTKKILNKRFFD